MAGTLTGRRVAILAARVGVICHGPWTLVEGPQDLPAFCRAIVAHFADAERVPPRSGG
jgi:hypothetical protein